MLGWSLSLSSAFDHTDMTVKNKSLATIIATTLLCSVCLGSMCVFVLQNSSSTDYELVQAEKCYEQGLSAYRDGDYKLAEKNWLKSIDYARIRSQRKALFPQEALVRCCQFLPTPFKIQVLEYFATTNSDAWRARTYRKLGVMYRSFDRSVEAEKSFDLALKFYEKSPLDRQSEYAGVLADLGQLCTALSRFSEAEQLLRNSLKINEHLLGAEDSETICVQENLAECLESQEKFSEAEDLFRKALHNTEKEWGFYDPKTAVALNNLGTLLERTGRYTEAEKLYQQSLDIDDKVGGKDVLRTALTLTNIASVLQDQHRNKESISYYKKALQIYKNSAFRNCSITAKCLNDLGTAYHEQGKLKEAEALYAESWNVNLTCFGAKHKETLRVKQNLDTVRQDLLALKS